jgi:microsomal dipeptidase-like Zn-dependent dipeptidase
MPYKTRKVKGKGTCVYKKEGGKKVGCTKGSIKKYLAALHSNVDEEIKKENKTMRITKAELMKIIKEEIDNMSEMETEQEEQPLQEMDLGSLLSQETIEALGAVFGAIKKLAEDGVIPMTVLGAGAGALANRIMGPNVSQDSGDE